MKKLNLLSGGAVSPEDTFKAINGVIGAMNSLSDDIGDINNHSGTTSSSFNSSVIGTIGDVEKLAPNVPTGETLTNFTETFAPSVNSDYYLTLTPITDITIVDGTNTYTKVDKTLLTDATHYAIDGRKLIFFKSPANNFTVNYKGKFPTVLGLEKYTPNTYPSIDNVKSGNQQKSTVTKISDKLYEVDIRQTNKVGNINIPNGIYASLPDKVRNFVSASGSIKAPVSDVSVWIYYNNMFQKIDDASVYLMSDQKFRFQTELTIPADAFIVLSVNSWTIADSVKFLMDFAINHSHNGEELGSVISHSNLSGLRSERYVHGKEYGVSKFSGDDHPQYFNRDGYVADNPGNFNNAIIGDVLIGSSNEYNLHNNVLDNSRKLFFGSISDGSSLMYDYASKGLKLFGAENGLKISTHAPQSSTDNLYGKGLEIDGNSIYSTGDKGGADNTFNIEAKTGAIKFPSALGGLSELFAKALNVQDVNLSGILTARNDAGIKIGDVSFIAKDGSVEVSSDNAAASVKYTTPVSIKNLTTETITPKDIQIRDDGKISFGDTDKDGSISAKDGRITVSGNYPIDITNSGKNTGIRYHKDGSSVYMNMYTSAENGGTSTETDHDTYLESGNGKVYLLKDTTKVQTLNGKKYGFGDLAGQGSDTTRVDNLKLMPRASLNAGSGDFYDLRVESSSLKDRRGINLGDTSAIYVTGTDTECPPGWLVVESKNGVVFVDARAGAIDCQTIVYSEVTTGNLKTFGTASIDKSLGVSENIDAGGAIGGKELNIKNKAIIGSIEVKDESRFTGSVSFTENVSINSSLDVGGSIVSKNRLTTNELQVDSSSIFNGPVSILKSARIDGNIVANGSFNTGGDLTVGGKLAAEGGRFEEVSISKLRTVNVIDAKGGVESSSKITATGNIETDADIVADGGRFSTQVKTNNLIVDRDTTIGGEAYVKGRLQVSGDITLGESKSNKLSVNADTIFNNNKTSFIGVADFADEATFKSEMNVGGQSKFMSLLTAKAGIEMDGPLTSRSTAEFKSLNVKESTYLNGDVSVSGGIAVSSTIRGDKGANISGDLQLGSAGSNAIISADTHFSNQKNIFGGEILATEKMTVSGDAVFNSKISIEGALNAAGNINAGGVSTLNTLKVQGSAEFLNGFRAEKQAQFQNIYATGKTILAGDVSTDGDVHINGSLTSLPGAIATLGVVSVLGSVSQTDNKATNQFAGDTFFNNKVSVAGALNVNGTFKTGSDDAGVVIEGNSVRINGETSFISSKRASIDALEGKTRKVVQLANNRSQRASQAAIALSTKQYTTINNAFIEDSIVSSGDMLCQGTLFINDLVIMDSSGRMLDSSSPVLEVIARRARYAP